MTGSVPGSVTGGLTVGVVGLGAMGAPMAVNIAAAGFPVLVADADPDRAHRLAAAEGIVAAEQSELARRCDVVVTMLPDSDVVDRVVGDLLADLRPGAVVVDMSSSDPLRTRALGDRVHAAGCRLVDAPVSGGVPKAVTGELAVMVGGLAEDVAAVEPVLRAVSARILPVGDLGAGHAMKALNNLCSAGGFLIGIEVLLAGKAFGLDPERMVEVLNASTGRNNSTERKFAQFVLSGTFDSSFGMDLLVKDMRIALDLARAGDVDLPFATECLRAWDAARTELGPGHDHTEVAVPVARRAGVPLTADPVRA